LIILLGQTELLVNNRRIQMSVIPLMHNDRVYLPLRYIAEALEYDVKWDENNRIVCLESR